MNTEKQDDIAEKMKSNNISNEEINALQSNARCIDCALKAGQITVKEKTIKCSTVRSNKFLRKSCSKFVPNLLRKSNMNAERGKLDKK